MAWWGVGAAVLAVGAGTLWLTRRARRALQDRLRRAARAAVHRFELRLERYRLVRRDVIEAQLLRDPAIHTAIEAYATQHDTTRERGHRLARDYIREIVPFFNVLSYYRVGYTAARLLLNLLYRVRCEYHHDDGLRRIPREDVVVYIANHRSNVDYVVLAYVLARGVSVSYAVGEWARVWPLEYIFKSFGSYFIRRRYREPLYHTVLERYVQLITRHGITQGIFVEGGLSRTGALRPAKIGLLDYIARTLLDSTWTGNIWLVPVAINYDRVLEDRSLIRETTGERRRLPRWRQTATVLRYLGRNLSRLATRRLRRYGRVAVAFGAPLSLRDWARDHDGVLTAPPHQRLPAVQALADEVLERVAAIMPVTPVPLVAASLLSFGETAVDDRALRARVHELRLQLGDRGATLSHLDLSVDAILERAWKTLGMRRLAHRHGEAVVVLPHQRPLLEYYANSIVHLLPATAPSRTMHPAHDPDPELPRLNNPPPFDSVERDS